jgi:hypothetical protein
MTKDTTKEASVAPTIGSCVIGSRDRMDPCGSQKFADILYLTFQ